MGCSGNKSMHELPGFTVRVANYLKSTVRWGMQRFPRVTDDVYQQRLAICATNECGQLVNESYCKHPKCGCLLAKKALRSIEACPLGMWSAVTENVVAPEPAPKPEPKATEPERRLTGNPATCRHFPTSHASFDHKAGTITLEAKCKRCGARLLLDGADAITHSISTERKA